MLHDASHVQQIRIFGAKQVEMTELQEHYHYRIFVAIGVSIIDLKSSLRIKGLHDLQWWLCAIDIR